MPRNDINCVDCGVNEVDHKISEIITFGGIHHIHCPNCGRPSQILLNHTDKNKDWFRPHFNLGLADENDNPVFVESKQQLRDLCLKNNCTNHALGDVRNITEI